MFMNEPDFDDEFSGSPGFEYGQAFPSPDSKQKNNDGSDLPSFRSAGIGTPQNSRARMLAQQRELQLKKRQSNMLSGGMVRSSLDSAASGSPMRQSTDRQFTPAVRQFSAPKTTAKDPSFDASPEKDSEFTRKSRGGVASITKASTSRSSAPRGNSRYSDEEEGDNRATEASRRAEVRHQNRDRDYRDSNTTNTGNRDNHRSTGGKNSRRAQYDDYDDDDYDLPEDTNHRHRNDRDRGGYNNQRDYNRDHDRDRGYDNRDYDRDRGYSNRDHDRDRGYDNRESYRGHYQYRDNDRGNNRDRDHSNGASKWAGVTGGRDLQQHSTSAAASDARYVTNTVGNTPPSVTKPHITQHQQQQSVPATLQLVPPDLSNMREFLTKPLPRNVGVLQCYIRRNKSGTNKLFPIYSLYLKEGDVFLMASKKRPKNKTSNYLISMDQTDLHRTGPNYLGKLRSNFMGTEFQVFDNGVNPKDTEDDNANSNSEVRCELGAVMYAANVLGSRGPRKMQVAMPGLDENERIIQMKDTGGAGEGSGDTAHDSILARMKDRNMRDLVYLINKPPRWNEQVGAYVLNFNGRVTMASVKNFQLVDPDEQNAVVLQFGRVGKDEFTMDLQHPISPFQAFATTLSSFDSKIACD